MLVGVPGMEKFLSSHGTSIRDVLNYGGSGEVGGDYSVTFIDLDICVLYWIRTTLESEDLCTQISIN